MHVSSSMEDPKSTMDSPKSLMYVFKNVTDESASVVNVTKNVENVVHEISFIDGWRNAMDDTDSTINGTGSIVEDIRNPMDGTKWIMDAFEKFTVKSASVMYVIIGIKIFMHEILVSWMVQKKCHEMALKVSWMHLKQYHWWICEYCGWH